MSKESWHSGQRDPEISLLSGADVAESSLESVKLRKRLGAYAQHAKYDTRLTTRSARAAFNDRFAREVDPDGVLTVAERERRAAAARKVYFIRLSLASVKARRGRAAS